MIYAVALLKTQKLISYIHNTLPLPQEVQFVGFS